MNAGKNFASNDRRDRKAHHLSGINRVFPCISISDGGTGFVDSEGIVKIQSAGARRLHPEKYGRKRRSSITKYLNSLDLKGLLNVSEVIDLRLKGLPLAGPYNEKEIRCANKIVTLYSKDRGKAVRVISDLNHRIVVENKKGLNMDDGKRLLNDLMGDNKSPV